MIRTFWKPALGISLALLALSVNAFAGGRGGGGRGGYGGGGRGGYGGGGRGMEGGGMNRGMEGGYGGGASHSPSMSTPRSPYGSGDGAGDRNMSGSNPYGRRNNETNPYAGGADTANRYSSSNPYAGAGTANRNQSNNPNAGAAAAGATYANRNQPDHPNAGAAAAGAGYANRNQSNYPNAGAAAAGAGHANRNQSNYPNAGAAAAGATYANRNYDNQYHPGMVNGYWNGNNYGVRGVGAWGAGSSMYGYGYGSYGNPYAGMIAGTMAGLAPSGQPVAQGQPGAGAAPQADYSQPINTAAAPPEQAVVDPAIAAFDQARDAFRAGDNAGALQLARQAVGQMPNDSTMQQFLGLVYFAQGQYDQAAAPIYAVLSVGPGWDWTTLIGNYSDANLYTQQLRSLEAYVKSNPRSAASRFVQAYHYITQGHGEAAVIPLKAVVALQPDDKVSAKLLASLQPAGAPTDATTSLAQAPAVDASKITGRWTAQGPQSTKIMLTIKDDGGFTWNTSGAGKPTSTIAGTSSVAGDVLSFNDTNGPNGALAGRVAFQDDDHFTFRLVGAPSDDPGLKFAR